jgi:hypothetical protein
MSGCWRNIIISAVVNGLTIAVMLSGIYPCANLKTDELIFFISKVSTKMLKYET